MRGVLIGLFFFLISLCIKSSDRYYFSNLSLENGLSQITVGSIFQDSYGFMWFGTRNGLNRFDGYNFDVFQVRADDSLSISDNHILCMVEDDKKNLWIGTNNGLNCLNLSTLQIKRYFNNPSDKYSIPHNTILSIFFDKDNHRLWVGTNGGLSKYDVDKDRFEAILPDVIKGTRVDAIYNHKSDLYIGARYKGLVVYNTETKKSETYSHIENNSASIASDYIKAILVDSKENLWIGTRNSGVSLLKKGEKDFIFYNHKSGLSNDYVRSITESPDGKILVGTFNGLNVIDLYANSVEMYTNYGMSQGNLSHYSIIATYFDNAQTLWVGTYAGGACYYNKSGEKFRFYNPGERNDALGIVGPIVETGDKLFIATEGTGLLEMNTKSESFYYHKILEGFGAYEKNIIKSLFVDGNNILCGTNMGTIYSFDLKSRRFSLIYDMKEEHSIYHLSRTENGDLVIGGVRDNGIILLSKSGIETKTFPVKGKPDVAFPDVRCFLEIEKNVFLVGTRNRGLLYYDYNNRILKEYSSESAKDTKHTLPCDYVTSILKDKNGNIWVGTFGGGVSLFDSHNETFSTYNTSKGLHDDNVCAIVESSDNHLWISTISGLSEFNVQSKTFENYTHSNGLKIDEFTLHAGIRLSNNTIGFSGNNGFILFNPDKISFNTFIPPIVLRRLYINNKEVVPNTQSKILRGQLNQQKIIQLNYNESNIAIEYSALNFVFSNKNQYSYMLQGFDKEWNHVGSRRVAYYTNIPPGEYRFIVEGSNNDNLWNDEGTSIIIQISPPFWKTWWAYCLYILVFSSIIFFIFRYFIEKKRLQNDIQIRQLEAKAQKEFHEARNRLFTNFSHELRTPLTLVMGPLDDILEKENLSLVGKEKVKLMQSNTRRLLRLVNNLMDFQKKESGTMTLRVAKGDFVQFTHYIMTFFYELAQKRGITLEFRHEMNTLDSWYDKDLMEKVYFNLLSNAFKNTSDGGSILVSVEELSLECLQESIPEHGYLFDRDDIKYLILQIKDSGIGIPLTELENIFVPFYQVAQNQHSSSGTGLGLSLSKSIIEMHRGVIWAESGNDEGAVFKCILPVTNECFTEAELEHNNQSYDSIFAHGIDIPQVKDTEYDKKKKRYTILVVEDNIDVRHYIVSILSDIYNIVEASNGNEALDKAINYLPDLIISDLMMPQMDGTEMCMHLKNDIRISHIPVIMLTAKSMDSDIKEGYNVGADDYIVKPFSASILVARVDNIIQSRNKLKEIYGKRFSLETLGIEAVSLDEQLLQKLYAIMEKNISNPEFSLDSFSQDIGMSRTNLYRKIKALTNLSPSEFVRNFRLTMSAKILKEAQLPVSEVYVAVGFNSHAYFSNCFKASYGVSPSEYSKG